MSPFNYGDILDIHLKTSRYILLLKEIEKLSLEKTRERVRAARRKNKETF